MSKSATQKGVQNSDAVTEEMQAAVDEARKNTLQSKQNELQELADARKEERDAELAAEGLDVVDTSGKESSEKPKNDDSVGFENENQDDETVDKSAESQNNGDKVEKAEEMVTIKVDGEEQQVPMSKVIEAGTRTMQKETSADTRLEQATQILKEAKATAEDLKSGSQPSTDVDDTTAGLSDEDRTALAKTLVDGDVDQVAEAIGKIMGTGRQTELATQAKDMQPNEVYGMVEGALQMKEALDTFKGDPESGGYGDLYSDETTRQMVFDKEAELAEADKEGKTTPGDRLRQAGDEVRAWRNNLIEQSGGKVVDFGSRDSKKAESDSTTSGSSTRVQTPTNEQPKSEAQKRREALNKMARSRGQHLD